MATDPPRPRDSTDATAPGTHEGLPQPGSRTDPCDGCDAYTFLQRIVSTTHSVLWASDREGRFTFVNAVAGKVCGRPPAELLGVPFLTLVPHSQQRRARLAFNSVLAGADIHGFECAIIPADGRPVLLRTNAQPLAAADGTVTGICGASADITAEQEALITLRDSEERFRATFDQAAVGIAHVAPDGTWLRVNRKLCEIVGYTRAELLARTFQDITHPDDLEADLAQVRRVLAGEISTYAMEKRYFHKDGRIVWINLTVSLVSGTRGEPKYFISVIEDITARRQALEERDRVAADLKETRERLQHSQKLEAVGRLAGGVAHDFNNLLTAILGHGKLLERNLPSGDARRHDLDALLAAAHRAVTLTRQLLTFSRKQLVVPRALDLNLIVADLASLLRRLIGEDVALETIAGKGLAAVLADGGEIEQVIMNLAVNARDAMPRGGRLTIETANADLGKVEVAGRPEERPGAYVRLSVRDTGCGMPPEVLEHIFEPFFTTKPLGQGTGLGLATAWAIVARAGGFIRVASTPGAGSTFSVFLPRAAAAAPAQPAAAPREVKLPRGTETILLVEDEEAIRGLAQRILEQCGYTVATAGNAAEALALASTIRGDIRLLLTDVVMPGMNGKELAARLRAFFPQLQVVYSSGYTDGVLDLNDFSAATDAFLPKPFTPEMLATVVRKALDGTPPEAKPGRPG